MSVGCHQVNRKRGRVGENCEACVRYIACEVRERKGEQGRGRLLRGRRVFEALREGRQSEIRDRERSCEVCVGRIVRVWKRKRRKGKKGLLEAVSVGRLSVG